MPDERVRDTIRLVFDVFARRGSVHGVLRYLVDHGIALPDRARSGPAVGEVVWRRPHRGGIVNMLTNPAYTGAYAFSRRLPERPDFGATAERPGSRAVIRRTGEYFCRAVGRPTSVGTATRRTRRRLDGNRSKHKGVPRGGPSLLAGLFLRPLRQRMVTCYRTNGRDLRYDCTHHQINYGAPHCQALSGAALDALITDLVLEVLRPAAVEVSLRYGRGCRARTGGAAPAMDPAP